MTAEAILLALLKYGPEILPVIKEIVAWIKQGKNDITPDDIQRLIDFGSKKADDYLTDIGVPVPPKD